eukprot:148396-Ditylum_brightwellii.AAC.1
MELPVPISILCCSMHAFSWLPVMLLEFPWSIRALRCLMSWVVYNLGAPRPRYSCVPYRTSLGKLEASPADLTATDNTGNSMEVHSAAVSVVASKGNSSDFFTVDW